MSALRIRVRGVVQGVGFRPFVYRLALRLGVKGWVLNGDAGVEVHAEAPPDVLAAFAGALRAEAPPAARVASVDAEPVAPEGFRTFAIRASGRSVRPTARIAPDLPACDACLAEMADPADRRFGYPYITCTDCGPRYSIVLDLPYDRPATTMRGWPLCPDCAREYADPAGRRFHAQPLACPVCGPAYRLEAVGVPDVTGPDAIARAAAMLRDGAVLAVKGIGGYHLACDARNEAAVRALRERKVRKEKPFALMARDLAEARALVRLSAEAEALLASAARPVVLAPSREVLPDVAPGNPETGVMLPHAPLHALLFAAGAPAALVMTSGNRSSEPIAYLDADARERLGGLADALLVGERPVARRVDDSVATVGPFGPVVLRRSRGYAPEAVARFPTDRPVLALGADLKNSVTLVVGGQAFVSQHVGDLGHYAALVAFRETVDDLLRMYDVDREALVVAHDLHPEYASTQHALGLPGEHVAVQHHRAHVASVLAEREALERRVVGVAFDGTGWGDDGTVWGGEVFVGSVAEGFERVAHLHPALLPGGDAAARHPVQAAAGFLAALDDLPDLAAPPFGFPARYAQARRLVETGVRTFATTSAGRLFDTVAALLGFTREMTFEGQAAIWLEHLAWTAAPAAPYPFPRLDWRPLLRAVVADRLGGRPAAEIARAVHAALAVGILAEAQAHAEAHGLDTVVLSGGVFQNRLLLEEIDARRGGLAVWTNRAVPPNDGGISLGQAALAVYASRGGQRGSESAKR